MPSPSQLDSLTSAVTRTGAEPKRTLLVVDDEEGPRQSLRIVFKDDYQVLLADNGFKAVDLAKQNRIDAAVLDIRMCGMSGIELLDRLKAIDPGIEVIMLTAYETLETTRQALRLGACDYLNKPFDIATMRESVAHAMHRRSVSDELRANQQKLELLKEEIQNQQLQLDSVRTRFEIYASILHDLNSPLTIIGGYIGTISDQIAEATRLDGQDIAQINHRLLLIRRQVQNCIEISHRYLRFLRQPPAENPAVPINQVLADLGHLLRAHPAARGHQLLIETLPRDVQAKINATELIQILLNLAVNALQATPQPHEVRIHGHRLAVPLNMAQFSDGPHDRFDNRDGFHNIPPLAVLVVTDNGPGIPPEVMPKLFEPFFTTKPNGRGTGLGLASVLRLLRQAHGAIALYSQPGHGASFTLYLPVKEASANPLA